MEQKTSVPSVRIKDIEKMIKKIYSDLGKDNNIELSFEFILATLFPTCYKNIMDDLKRQYTLGYIQATEDLKCQHTLGYIEVTEDLTKDSKI